MGAIAFIAKSYRAHGALLQVQPVAQRFRIEWPTKLAPVCCIAQYRHAFPITRLKRHIAIDKHTVELRRPHLCQQGQRQVAQVAVVALVKDESHRGMTQRWEA